ncbi:MAG: type II toxin-antitoxin system RelE/ParE family toxin [Chloroflexota bacterium]
MRSLAWGRRAISDLEEIARRDRRQAERIRAATERYASDDLGDVLKMAGASDVYRLRVGDWRIIFILSDGGKEMTISRVLNRRDAYR